MNTQFFELKWVENHGETAGAKSSYLALTVKKVIIRKTYEPYMVSP
jgi:hypothetical protein